MKNPVRVIIDDLGLTPRAFAVFNGLSLDTVKSACNGKCRRPPAKVKDALQRAGVDITVLDDSYAKWLLWRAQEDVQQLARSK